MAFQRPSGPRSMLPVRGFDLDLRESGGLQLPREGFRLREALRVHPQRRGDLVLSQTHENIRVDVEKLAPRSHQQRGQPEGSTGLGDPADLRHERGRRRVLGEHHVGQGAVEGAVGKRKLADQVVCTKKYAAAQILSRDIGPCAFHEGLRRFDRNQPAFRVEPMQDLSRGRAQTAANLQDMRLWGKRQSVGQQIRQLLAQERVDIFLIGAGVLLLLRKKMRRARRRHERGNLSRLGFRRYRHGAPPAALAAQLLARRPWWPSGRWQRDDLAADTALVDVQPAKRNRLAVAGRPGAARKYRIPSRDSLCGT
jgi:hypothetical protein